ncbi:hypothetical protein BN946_scf184842.g17 [Trametes cinnabarina]|uniref:Uncharacterized protein n=1 Tax=Pycnoporus cinnabarinus TaxID=5643 RepID=A0A060S7J3_PYCCI|nr:hypothetical protein BN946_scf184842.g17 [Trametes cinnabarina]
MARSFVSLTLLVTCLLSVLTSVLALNAVRANPDSPPITLPTAQNAWTLGTVETVKWLTDGYNVNGTGSIILGISLPNGSVDFWQDQPLAEGFPLSDGIVNVRCPLNLPTTRRYVIALLPDESNQSPPFMVLNGTQVEPTSIETPPATLLTTGNVPPATITRSSVVGTIPPPSSSGSAETSNAGSSFTQVSSTSTGPQPTQTGSQTNGALNTINGETIIAAAAAAAILVIAPAWIG